MEIVAVITGIAAAGAGVAIVALLRRIDKLKEEARDLEQTVEYEKNIWNQLRDENKRLKVEKEELRRRVKTLSMKVPIPGGFSIGGTIDKVELLPSQNKLDKVLGIMDQEDLETEALANQDGDLAEEAAENEEYMNATMQAKADLEDLLTEDEKRAWEHGAMSEAMRDKLGGKK